MSDRVSLRQVAALGGFLLNDKFFRCDHSLRRADRSVSLDPEL